jgi:hypothetical protein
MAQGRRPRGIQDDIAKKIASLLKSGTKNDKVMARRLQELMEREAGLKKQVDYKKGKAALIREWDRKLGADYYINRDITSAKTRGQKAAYESRKRGFESKTKGVGARQQANPSKAIDAAAARQQKRADWVKAGGKNASQKAAGRRTKAEQARKIVRQESTAASRAASRQRMKNKINRARGPR